MPINNSYTPLQKLRARLLDEPITEQSVLLPDFDPSTVAQINSGTYDWKQQPRWATDIPFTAHHRKQRRTIIERLCEDAVGDPDAADIGLDMLKCSRTFPCGSPFCPFCRHKQQEQRAKKALNKFAATAKDEMTFLTILHPVTYDPMHDASTHIRYIRDSVRNALNHRRYKQVRMLGAFEIDVKRSQDAKTPRSNQVLTALNMNTTSRQPAYLVHLHTLVDLGGIPRKQVRRVFTRAFDKPYQVRLSHLRYDINKDASIERIARYMFKFRAQFSDNLFGKEVELRAKYKELYPAPLMREYVQLIHSLKTNNGFKGFRFEIK